MYDVHVWKSTGRCKAIAQTPKFLSIYKVLTVENLVTCGSNPNFQELLLTVRRLGGSEDFGPFQGVIGLHRTLKWTGDMEYAFKFAGTGNTG